MVNRRARREKLAAKASRIEAMESRREQFLWMRQSGKDPEPEVVYRVLAERRVA